MSDERPLCECHGKPMRLKRDARPGRSDRWTCSERSERDRARDRGRKRGPGLCGKPDCSEPRLPYASGFHGYCRTHQNESVRKAVRRRRGIQADAAIFSHSDAARLKNAVRGLKRAHDDPVAMKLLEASSPRKAKLLRLAFHPATPVFERRRALDKLIPVPAPGQEAT